MKRIFLFILGFALLLSLTACGSGGEKLGNSIPGAAAQMPATDGTVLDAADLEITDAHILVVYFSNTGTTENIANHLSEILDADLYQITPEVPYTSADLNYNDSASRSSREQNDPAARPAILGGVDNMAEYDVVFIGYPIWFGQAPKIISTFLESYDFSGKIIVPFCTSGGSGIGSSATNLYGLCSDHTTWKQGKRFAAGTSDKELTEWLNELGFGK